MLEPLDALGIQVVGRFVEQQQVVFLKQRLAEEDAPPFAAGEVIHEQIGRWEPHRVHGDFELTVHVVGIRGVDLGLDAVHLRGQLVEVLLVRRGELLADLLLLFEHRADVGDGFLDVLAHGFALGQQRLLRHVADARVLLGPRGPHELLVLQGHDAEQRGLARSVRAEHADLRPRIEREVDVLEDGGLAVLLGEILDGEDVAARP